MYSVNASPKNSRSESKREVEENDGLFRPVTSQCNVETEGHQVMKTKGIRCWVSVEVQSQSGNKEVAGRERLKSRGRCEGMTRKEEWSLCYERLNKEVEQGAKRGSFRGVWNAKSLYAELDLFLRFGFSTFFSIAFFVITDQQRMSPVSLVLFSILPYICERAFQNPLPNLPVFHPDSSRCLP